MYECKPCSYKTDRLADYNRHNGSARHVKNIHKKKERKTCERCNKRFAFQSGLSRHEKRHHMHDLIALAEQKVKEYTIVKEILRTNEELQRSNDQLRIEKEQMEQALMSRGASPAVGGSGVPPIQINVNCNNRQYNTFNIHLFLNEQCKNAMNLDEFMQMVEIPQAQIESCKTQTVVQSISEALVTALSRLSLYERPIHCSDRKRSTLYIKENDKWDRDLEHDRMKNVIEEVNLKQFIALKQWINSHPEYQHDDEMMLEYLQMTKHLSTDLNANNGYRKIINHVGQEVHLDKPSPYQFITSS